jgi:hypothetical protein
MTDFRIEKTWTTAQIQAIGDARYLMLDQTTPQTVDSGLPLFHDGIKIGNATTKFLLNSNTLELWVNGTLIQSWTITPTASYLLKEDGDQILTEAGDSLILES